MPERRLDLRHSGGLRWGVIFAAVLGSSLLATFGLTYWRSSFLLFDTLDRSVLEQVELLSARPPDLLPFMITSRMHHEPAVLTQVGLFDAGGAPVVGEIETMPAGLIADGRIHQIRAPMGFGRYWRAAARRLSDGRTLVAARSADEILKVRSDLIRGAAVGIVPAILLSLIGGVVVGVTTERRLRRINVAAERVMGGELAARLPGSGNRDELGRLCATVNRMLDRNETNVTALSSVGDNIAHDLRTPLTALRSRLERTQRASAPGDARNALTSCIANVDQALAIIRALLRIADIRHQTRTADFRQVNLAEVVSETADVFLPLAEEKGIGLSVLIANDAGVVGDRQLLTEALVNLVDNAIKFTNRAGTVELALRGGPSAPEITVSDDGPGIAQEQRALVFRRFHRVDASRGTQGIGLGLSLVVEIARLHGFTAELDDTPRGCRFRLICHEQVRASAAKR